MRIAMLSTPFLAVPPKNYGGTELVVSELFEGLREQGHEVVLFATGDSCGGEDLRFFFREAQWPPDSLTDLSHISWAMNEIFTDGRFDLVHAHSALALAVFPRLANIPIVYTLHHVRDETLSAFYQRFTFPFYVAISNNQKRLEVPLPRCRAIHHALDSQVYQWTETAEDYVCFVGRFAPVKGLHTAIDVAGAAGLNIRVAGEAHPTDKEYADREVWPRMKQSHVEFLGCLGLEGKVPLLRNARALLSPIEWEEPFGLILIEAMLSGCPVVAFPQGSVPELVEPGVTGFIANSAEEMADIIRPGGVLDSFDRRKCRERAVRRFGRQRMILEHEAFYRDAIRAVRNEQTTEEGVLSA